jgi:hypothetical protein
MVRVGELAADDLPGERARGAAQDPATSAYLLTNFAVCGVSPAMSCQTSTCASHRGPAPIPMVGMDGSR